MNAAPVPSTSFANHPSLPPQRLEIEEIIARHVRRGDGSDTPVPGLRVGRIIQPVPPSVHMAEACVCVLIRGSRSITVGETVFTQNEGTYLLSTVGLPSIVAIADASSAEPYTALRIDLDLDLARLVMADIDVQSPYPAVPDLALSSGKIEPELFDAVLRLVRLIETPKGVRFLSDLLHREILYHLLSGPAARKFRQMVRLGTQGNRAAKAVTWLRSHFREPLMIRQLADVAGMGESTLHRHFHELTGMSPIQYQKSLRLHEARRVMLPAPIWRAAAPGCEGAASTWSC
jgi:hypothetical protein